MIRHAYTHFKKLDFHYMQKRKKLNVKFKTILEENMKEIIVILGSLKFLRYNTKKSQ